MPAPWASDELKRAWSSGSADDRLATTDDRWLLSVGGRWNNYGCRPTFELKGSGLCDWIGREIANPPFGLYHSFLVNIIGPNIRIVGFGVWLAEITVAILLFLGLFTRLGGLIGSLQGLNLLIGLWNVPGQWHSAYLMLFALNLMFLIIPAGRFLGADQFLLPRLMPASEQGNLLARLLARLM